MTRDPELKFTASGSAVANFGLAINRTWTDKDGRKRQTSSWHVEFRDHKGLIRRVAGFKDKKLTVELGHKLERLAECRQVGGRPDPDLARWIETMLPRLRKRLSVIGLLGGTLPMR